MTLHDLSFECAGSTMGRLDRLVFRTVVPRAARRPNHVLVVSERTKTDVIGRYGVAAGKVTVTPNGVDPSFTPGGVSRRVPALRRRDSGAERIHWPRSRLPARSVCRSSSPGPKRTATWHGRFATAGADLRGYVSKDDLADLYRGAAALVLPSRFEGFGLPVLEAMACGTPVVAAAEPALEEVAADAAVYAVDGDYGAAAQRALADRERLSAAGIERAKHFSWEETARRTAAVYRQVRAA